MSVIVSVFVSVCYLAKTQSTSSCLYICTTVIIISLVQILYEFFSFSQLSHQAHQHSLSCPLYKFVSQVVADVHAVVPRPFSTVDSPVHFVAYAEDLLAWLDDVELYLKECLIVGEVQSIRDCLNKIKAMQQFAVL